jgi:hypothetical protein
MLYWLKHESEWLIIIFGPAGCTGVFQPCDLGLEQVYQPGIHYSGCYFFTAEVRIELECGTSPADDKLRSTLPSLRDSTISRVVHTDDHLNNLDQKTLCVIAWSNCHVKD